MVGWEREGTNCAFFVHDFGLIRTSLHGSFFYFFSKSRNHGRVVLYPLVGLLASFLPFPFSAHHVAPAEGLWGAQGDAALCVPQSGYRCLGHGTPLCTHLSTHAKPTCQVPCLLGLGLFFVLYPDLCVKPQVSSCRRETETISHLHLIL